MILGKVFFRIELFLLVLALLGKSNPFSTVHKKKLNLSGFLTVFKVQNCIFISIYVHKVQNIFPHFVKINVSSQEKN